VYIHKNMKNNNHRRMKRPWDKAFRRCNTINNVNDKDPISGRSIRKSTNAIESCIIIDGKSYYSDRFYLNEPLTTTKNKNHATQPPLFNRKRLIESLDLIAVIVSTYKLDVQWLQYELPMLFPKPSNTTATTSCDNDNSIPTLVLHGHRGLHNQQHMKNKERIFKASNHSKQNINKNGTYHNKKEFITLKNTNNNGNQKISKNPNQRVNNVNISALQNNTYQHQQQRNEIIEIVDDDKVSNDDNDDECQVIQCINNNYGSKRIKSLAMKHDKALYQSPIYKQGTHTDDDTDCEHEEDETAVVVGDDSPTKNGNKQISQTLLFGKSVHLTEILPRFIPQPEEHYRSCLIRKREVKKEQKVSLSTNNENENKTNNHIINLVDTDDDTDDKSTTKGSKTTIAIGIDSSTVFLRKSTVGVHHPKYMLLFEKSGSIIVIVSTSNLTCSSSAIDASWIQRFGKTTSNPTDTNDFGHVLSDFLQKQSNAAQEGQMLPLHFLQRYVNIYSWNEFSCKYQFDTANVHLISTVPGIYNGNNYNTQQRAANIRRNPKRQTANIVLYGPQRVSEITSKLKLKRDILRTPNSIRATNELNGSNNTDRLLLQTTTFGSDWKSHYFENLGRIYMNLDHTTNNLMGNAKMNANTNKSYHASIAQGRANRRQHQQQQQSNVLDRMDVVWPSMEFIESLNASISQTRKNNSLSKKKCCTTTTFLSTKSFNSIDLACISRMVQYEPCPSLPVLLQSLPPHIKTISRILGEPQNTTSQSNITNDEYHNEQKKMRKEGTNTVSDFAWIMLTSACLSRGAQGMPVEIGDDSNNTMTYSNFELGVLFCSRLEGNHETDKLYCSLIPSFKSCCPNERNIKGEVSDHHHHPYRGRLIPLPIPYLTRPLPYQPDPEEADFCQTPCTLS